MRFFLGYAVFFFLGIHTICAQLILPDILTSNMVFQRDKPIHFWGKGIPNTSLEVQFGSKMLSTTVGQDSTWNIVFKKRKANPNPQSIQIKNEQQKIVLTNILVGDIWLCIGQSNMEWPMEKEQHFAAEVKNTNQTTLRFYNPTYAGKHIYNESFSDSVLRLLNTEDFYKGKWAVSDSNSVKKMSAVGYYFGAEILKNEQLPIGLINLAIGGAPIETFVRREAMEKHRTFSKKVNKNWLTNDELPIWIRERGQQNTGNIQVIHEDDLGPNHAFKPGFAYTSGLEPILQLPIKGILWYQGESNAQELERVNEYLELQKLMIDDYRKQWKQPELPFYWTQLSSIDTVKYKSQYWPEFRDEQRKLLTEIKHGGMAVTIDIGSKNNVHPTDKKTVGHRLARLALNKAYQKEIIPSGPFPNEASFKSGEVIVTFYDTASGLKTSNGNIVQGFSLDGKHKVPAKLTGNTVTIPTANKPEFIYYGWQPYSEGNLVNSVGLPASTFKIRIQ